MSSNRSIEPSNIFGIGMIFLKREDVVSNLIMTLSHFRYNLIGFYYETRASGTKQIKVLLTDLSDIGSGKWLRPINIEDILSDINISAGIIRKFTKKHINKTIKDPDDNGKEEDDPTANIPLNKPEPSDLFRGILASIVIDRHSPNSPNDYLMREWLYHLFNHSNGDIDYDIPTSISLVNKLIFNMFTLISGHNHNKTEDEDGLDAASNSIDSSKSTNSLDKKIDSLKQDVNTRYLLMDLGLFKKAININLSKTIRKSTSIKSTDSTSLLRFILKNFSYLYMNDPKFSECVLHRIGSDDTTKHIHLHTIIIQNLLSSSDRMIDYIQKSMTRGEMDPSQLSGLVHQYIQDSDNICDSVHIDRLFHPNDKVQEDMIRLIRVCSDKQDSNLVNSPDKIIRSLHTNIHRLVKSALEGSTPLINLNEISDGINSLVDISGLDLDEIPSIEGETSIPSISVITLGHNTSIPIRLSSEKKILLSMTGNDLSNFSRQQLLEILSMLDVRSDGDNRFDDLRTKIVEHLE